MYKYSYRIVSYRIGCISKSSSGSGGGGGAPPTITPPGGEEGPSEDAPVDGDFDVSMYRSKAGWEIQSSSSSSKNASSNVLLVPTRTGLRPRERLRRGVMTRGNDRREDRDRLRRETR